MGDGVAAQRALFFGQELDLELSAESATGFKGVRKVRANKDSAPRCEDAN